MKKILQTTLVAAMLLFSQNVLAQTITCNNTGAAPTTIPVLTGQISSYAPIPTVFAVSGMLEIDININLTNKTIYMEQTGNTYIDITNNSIFELNQSHVKACNTGGSWNEILVDDPHEKLVLNETTIEDAEFAVHSENGGWYDIKDSELKNNGTHLLVANYHTSHLGSVVSTLFTSQIVGGAAFPVAQNSIDIVNVKHITIGNANSGKNTILYSNIGIQTRNSSVDILNNQISKMIAISSPFGGTAIYARGTPAQNNYSPSVHTVRIGSMLANAGNEINYSENGIIAREGINLEVHNNEIAQNNGSAVDTDAAGNITIGYNEIYHELDNGIIVSNIESRTIIIHNNHIEASDMGIVVFGHNRFNAAPPQAVGTTVQVYENEGVIRIREGIRIADVQEAEVWENHVSLSYPTPTATGNRIGIRLIRANFGEVRDNFIADNAIGFLSMGIQCNDSPGSLIIENKVINADWGVGCIRTLDNISLQCNTVENCGTGFYFTSNTDINGSSSGTLNIVGDFTANVASGNRWVNCNTNIQNNNSGIMINWWYNALNPEYDPTPLISAAVNPITFTGVTDPNCFPAPARLADPSLALAENEVVKVYPNPTSNIVNISLPNDEAILLVYDLTGRLVLEQNLVSGSNTVDVNSLNAGIYQSKIVSRNTIISADKIVISR